MKPIAEIALQWGLAARETPGSAWIILLGIICLTGRKVITEKKIRHLCAPSLWIYGARFAALMDDSRDSVPTT